MWVFVLLKPIVILITDGYSINPQETAEAIERLKTCALVRRNKILREEYTIGDELIPELVFALQVDDRSLVFKVYELGHIQEADLLRKIINFFCFSYFNMIFSAHQPNYFPYLGLFYKIYKSDIFVFLDDVQFTKSSGPAHERNKISKGKDVYYIKVTIKHKFKDKINEVKINYAIDWMADNLEKIELCYHDAPYYEYVMDDIKPILLSKYDNLAELNIALIKLICEKAKINCEFYKSSEFNIQSKKTKRLIELGKILKCNEYYSGIGAKTYMDCEAMSEEGIRVTYSNYKTAIYDKHGEACNCNMSVLDYIFYYGYDFSKLGWK